MKLAFTKMDGAGNDFVALDRRGAAPLADDSRVARMLCDRHHGVGADGVLVLSDAPGGDSVDFTMVYYNADGSIGEMCGNGARCMAVFAHRIGAAADRMTFATGAGVYTAQVDGESAIIDFPDIQSHPVTRKLRGPMHPGMEFDYLLVGVPHAVRVVEELDLMDVTSVGRVVRHDPEFAPRGTNANFVEEQDGRLLVRTYERGVEVETLACGTGSVAAACCDAWRSGRRGAHRYQVVPTGGAILSVSFELDELGFTNVKLGGPARAVFTGSIDLAL